MTTTAITQTEKYREGLRDIRWKRLRISVLERDGHQCRSCGKWESLHVHHRQYHREMTSGEWKHPWEYDTRLLVTLCDTCHSTGHRLYAIPIKEV